MVVLSAIGRFFKKIWDWIRQTAWIQPLLIVGIIFGVIFSIPPIVKAIQKADDTRRGAEYFYQKYQLSLEGGENSPAAKLTTAIENNDKEAIGSKDKFFLAFVESDSEEWKTWKDGFQEMKDKLESNAGKKDDKKDQNFISVDGSEFKLYTIFIDQKTSDTKDDDQTAFEKYLENHLDYFFTDAVAVAENSFYGSKNITDSQYDSMLEPDGSGFKSTATLMLVDMSPDAQFSDYDAGVNEIIFGVPSGISEKYYLAKFLMDCWNHTGDFAFKAN